MHLVYEMFVFAITESNKMVKVAIQVRKITKFQNKIPFLEEQNPWLINVCRLPINKF